MSDPRLPLAAESAPDAGSARARLHRIVFESDTPAGRAFDVALIALIVTSVVVVSLDTVPGYPPRVYTTLRMLEWTLTILFTIEYLLRLVAVRRPLA